MAETRITDADDVAMRLGYNGTSWQTWSGLTFEELVSKAILQERYVGGELAARRYVFPDGSAILEACGNAGWWDQEAEGRPWVPAGAPEDGEIMRDAEEEAQWS